MRGRVLLALVVAASLAACGGANPIEPDDLKGIAEHELTELTPDRDGVGMVAVLIRGEKQEVVAIRDVLPEAIFELGSATQALTGLLLADMVDKRQISLEDPISKWLPPGTEAPTRSGEEITVENLATHRASLPRFPPNLQPDGDENPWAKYSDTLLFEAIAKAELSRPLGTTIDESLYGYGLLGHVLARAGARPYADLLATRVTRTLGMNDTGLAVSAELEPRAVRGHRGGGDVDHWDLPSLESANALRSTGGDMARLLRAVITPASSPLGPALELATKIRAESGTARMGLGWRERSDDEVRIVYQEGRSHGFRSYIGFEPSKGVGVVMLANFEGVNPGPPGIRMIKAMTREDDS